MNSEAFFPRFLLILVCLGKNPVDYTNKKCLWPEDAKCFMIETQRKQTDYRCGDIHNFETGMTPRQILYQDILY